MLPDLATPRLLLRPHSLADLDDCFAMDLDPLVARFIWGAPPEPETHREVLRGRFAPDWPEAGGMWVVEERAAPGFLGWCGLFPLEKTGLIEIGYRYLPKALGPGLCDGGGRLRAGLWVPQLRFRPHRGGRPPGKPGLAPRLARKSGWCVKPTQFITARRWRSSA